MALALSIACVGCDDEPPPVGCGFGPSALHAHAEGGEFDDVELLATPSGAALLYTDRAGTYLRRLDAAGVADGSAVRLTTPCPAGLAATQHGSKLLVACARPADLDRDRAGEVLVGEVAGEGVQWLGRLEGIGPRGGGTELVSDGRRAFLGWVSVAADELSSRAFVVELRDGRLGEPRALSSTPMLAGPPSFALVDGTLHTAWSESWLEPGGQAAGHLFVQREGDPPVPSLELHTLRAPVRLRTLDGLVVALRDRRPRGAAHERAIAGRLDERLRLVPSALRSPARADDPDSDPTLVACGGHVFSVTTRRSRRQVTMVSLRRLGAELRPAEGEHQIYEYHARFPRVAAACVGEQLLVAVGEQRSRVSPSPRLRTYTLRCGPGVTHERTPGTEGQVLRKRGAGP